MMAASVGFALMRRFAFIEMALTCGAGVRAQRSGCSLNLRATGHDLVCELRYTHEEKLRAAFEI